MDGALEGPDEGETEGLPGLATGEAAAEEEDLDLPPPVRDLKVLRREE